MKMLGYRRISPVVAHHVGHFNTAQDSRCARGRFEAEHVPDPALDAPVILLDAVAKILTLADTDPLQRSAGSILQPALTVADNDCLSVRLAAINDDTIGPAMMLQRWPRWPSGRSVAYQLKAARFPVYRDLAGFDFASSEITRSSCASFIGTSLWIRLITSWLSAVRERERLTSPLSLACRRSSATASASSPPWNSSTLEQQKAQDKVGPYNRHKEGESTPLPKA
ncbi:hypothetical protein ABID44_003161 [Aquamicrobium ahrensii]|uniref:Uncharacterized protein n=1 Tax=Aquamicrobium ahrensii TaxID=469551 RepID=A0ABV2KNZ9_9HYPH